MQPVGIYGQQLGSCIHVTSSMVWHSSAHLAWGIRLVAPVCTQDGSPCNASETVGCHSCSSIVARESQFHSEGAAWNGHLYVIMNLDLLSPHLGLSATSRHVHLEGMPDSIPHARGRVSLSTLLHLRHCCTCMSEQHLMIRC